MNKVKEFFKNKKNLFVVIGVFFVVLLLVFIFVFNDDDIFVQSDGDIEQSKKFKNEYEDLNGKLVDGVNEYPKVNIPTNDLVKYAKMDDVLKIFKNMDDAVIYFGFSRCLYCRSAVQVLFDTAVDTELDEIYYVNMEDVWPVKEIGSNKEGAIIEANNNKYNDLLKYLGDELVTDYIVQDKNGKDVKSDEKEIELPLVIFVVNGQIVSYNKGTLFSQVSPYDELDQSQIDGLGLIYSYGIKDVLLSKNNKK